MLVWSHYLSWPDTWGCLCNPPEVGRESKAFQESQDQVCPSTSQGDGSRPPSKNNKQIKQ